MLERESRGSVKETMLESIANLGSVLSAERPRILTCATLIDHLDNEDACIQATSSALLLGEPVGRSALATRQDVAVLDDSQRHQAAP